MFVKLSRVGQDLRNTVRKNSAILSVRNIQFEDLTAKALQVIAQTHKMQNLYVFYVLTVLYLIAKNNI